MAFPNRTNEIFDLSDDDDTLTWEEFAEVVALLSLAPYRGGNRNIHYSGTVPHGKKKIETGTQFSCIHIFFYSL